MNEDRYKIIKKPESKLKTDKEYMQETLRDIWNMIKMVKWIIIGLFILCISTWVTQSYFEAKAYNNVTGKKVSTLDAMFIELRVQEGAK